MASYPINERADCNKPSIQATPSGQPVSFVNCVKTNSAFVFGAVARITADVAIQAVRDQNTASVQTCEILPLKANAFEELRILTSPFIPLPQEAISKDVQANREERDGEEVHVRVPRCQLHRVVRPGNNGGGDELGFFFGSFVSRPVLFEQQTIPNISDRHLPPKTASVVTSVNQPAMLIHPTRKL
jgi:hypothetical protein